ncbi:MAG: radical SAM protein [Bacteroidetes bacterium]|jgi:wyosine [tRNA(Phe)-imidazoG37] synthetase (radical SAM superfamily)|nr:radical SAM protein [Bacteroidota bacterium]MBT3747574.1 radical SAM protein [Bacteroidota bacterium]MBT4410566.1 radical SAM protein [Bacteroidota bacterium]MBT5425463.1 radical SAM protein [Bacteroidota bacterium]MBT7092920.1 radical SAM protein [Bacteroidota bacterium]
MSTFLFEEIIFGPVTSRRLGASLGINLLPGDRKICNFNCIYCECGWTKKTHGHRSEYPVREHVKDELKQRLLQMKSAGEPLDTITYAGNGEPTLHPDFPGIIDDCIELRDQIFPDISIAVLSNASRISNANIFNALIKIDQNILKIDSAFPETIKLINQTKADYNLDSIIEKMKMFKGNFTLQTLFVKGSYQEVPIDNSSDKEVQAWLEIVKLLMPQTVMVYTIARDTPIQTLEKVSASRLDAIAEEVRKLGLEAAVSY